MSNFFRITLVALLFLLPSSVFAEVIENFDVHIDLHEDGSFTVTEEILYDFENAQRHGMFRTIPTSHPQDASSWYKERYIDIDVQSVRMDGGSVPYEITTPGDAIKIKIGDPNKTITGLHTYTLVYEVAGALSQTGDVTELYWNATGHGWNIPIGVTRVEIHAPRGTLKTAQACYVGTRGSTERCSVGRGHDGMSLFIGRALSPGEGVTVAQALDGERIAIEVFERTRYEIFIFLGIAVLILAGGVWLFRAHRKHKTRETIVAQYEPYEQVRPMYAGMLIDGTLHARDITAGIVYLAEQGFLKIKKTSKTFLFFNMNDYEVTLLKDPQEIQGEFLPRVMELLFGYRDVGNTVTLSHLKKNYSKQRINHRIMQELKKSLRRDLEAQGLYERYGWFGVFRRRTRKGYEAMNNLKGFKEFLSVTGKDRFAFHNAPEKSPEQFLEFLPYAIAFGVEKKWAEVFRDISIPDPAWYDGGSAGAFSAAAFSSDMSAFSGSLSSSSGAASSGGGAAGSGAGGGGGGSW